MAKQAVGTLHTPTERGLEAARQAALIVGGSLFVALCAHITIPLMPLTPVPLTTQNFGVLLVGLLLGSRRGFAALMLYLAEGVVGFHVFSPGPGGITQLFGVTGGFLMAYPFVAWSAGFVMEHGKRTFARAAIGGLLGEVLLFTVGLTWLTILTHSIAQAFRWGFQWFIFAEVIKVMVAAGIASRIKDREESREAA